MVVLVVLGVILVILGVALVVLEVVLVVLVSLRVLRFELSRKKNRPQTAFFESVHAVSDPFLRSFLRSL